MLNEEHWGKKKLAFPVKKQARGNFVVFHFAAPVGTLEELERTFRNLDVVIRYLSATFGAVRDVDARRAEVEKRAKERAQARARQEAERQEREERMAREAAEGGGRDRDRDRDRGDRDRDRGDRDRDRDRYDDQS
jgi:ribosomal protein S6